MRSMELVGRERMEVAVRFAVVYLSRNNTEKWYSNNSQSGVKVATMMFPM